MVLIDHRCLSYWVMIQLQSQCLELLVFNVFFQQNITHKAQLVSQDLFTETKVIGEVTAIDLHI